MFHGKTSGNENENVLNVFCLTDESFTRYSSALFGCGFPLNLLLSALLKLAVGLA